MKFRDPKTGEVFDANSLRFCGEYKNRTCTSEDGEECPFSKMVKKYGDCYIYSIRHPQEAARLMGYELVDDTAKHDIGKPRPTLVPVSLINAVTDVREYGTQKYGDPENWRNVEVQRYRDALYRHWLAYLGGERIDPESGLPHMYHVACNASFIIELDGDAGR